MINKNYYKATSLMSFGSGWTVLFGAAALLMALFLFMVMTSNTFASQLDSSTLLEGVLRQNLPDDPYHIPYSFVVFQRIGTDYTSINKLYYYASRFDENPNYQMRTILIQCDNDNAQIDGGASCINQVWKSDKTQYLTNMDDGQVMGLTKTPLYKNWSGISLDASKYYYVYMNNSPYVSVQYYGTTVGTQYLKVSNNSVWRDSNLKSIYFDTSFINLSATISSLQQFKSDRVTPIEAGGAVTENPVMFQGVPVSSVGNQLWIKVEVFDTSNNQIVSTITSSIVSSGSVATTTLFLPNGSYRWRAQAIDTFGTASNVAYFGTSTSTDFTVQVAHIPDTSQLVHDTELNLDVRGWMQKLGSGYTSIPSVYWYMKSAGDYHIWMYLVQCDNADALPLESACVNQVVRGVENHPLAFYGWNSASSTEEQLLHFNYNLTGLDSSKYFYFYPNLVGDSSHFRTLGTNTGSQTENESYAYAWHINNLKSTYFDIVSPASATISSLQQFKSDRVTPIEAGDIVTENTVVFQATPISSVGNQLWIKIEAFDASNNLIVSATTSSIVSSGSVATTTLFLPNGSYRWRAQAIDTYGIASDVVYFGTSTSTDFTVQAVHVPGNSILYQYSNYQENDRSMYTGHPWGAPLFTGSSGNNDNSFHFTQSGLVSSVTVKKIYYEPQGGNQNSTYRIYLCAWHNTYCSNGSDVIAISAITNINTRNGNYRGDFTFYFDSPVPVDTATKYSAFFSVGGGWLHDMTAYYNNWESYNQTWYGNPAVTMSSLGQFKSDGIISINEGGTTTENTVVFQATPISSVGNQVQLQIELRQLSESFIGQTTASSTFVQSGNIASVTIFGLVDAQYHWRARAVDSQGNTSQWQEFGTIGNADFVVHQVPLITQIDPQWALNTYGNGNYLGNCFTIGNCGCVITSMTMLGKYYGVLVGVDGTEVNPANINSWLTTNSGYLDDGRLKWGKAQEYLGVLENGIKKTYLSLDYYNASYGTMSSVINDYINSNKPAVAYSEGFGHYFIVNGKLSSTYSVKDPLWYETKTLNDTDNINQHIRGYSNTFDRANLFSMLSNPRPISAAMYLYLASPAEYLVTDPQGRRTGINPTTNTTYNDIPGASYSSEGPILDSDVPIDPNSLHMIKTLYIPAPLDGNYDVKIIGTGTGNYTASSLIYDNSGNSQTKSVTGNTQPDLTADYNLNFDSSSSQETSLVPTDTVPPTTSVSLSGQQGFNNWFISDVTETLSAADNVDGTGVYKTEYSLDGGTNWQAYSAPFVVSGNGQHTVLYHSQDFVGNTEDNKSIVVKIDTNPTLANIWIGLKNSDDVGIKFDLRAEIYRNNELVAIGTIDSVAGGSSGFNNAHLYSIPISISTPAVFSSGDTLSLKLLVRNACSGSGKNSGGARLWYGDSNANSNLGVTLTNLSSYFLIGANTLDTNAGLLREHTDVASGAKCSSYKTFGTWGITF